MGILARWTGSVWEEVQAAAAAHHAAHEPAGSDPMAVDAAAATGSLRTLGTGATQAAVGSHTHSGTTVGMLANGYAAVTADQTAIGTSVTDLTGLTVTVTVASGQRIKITAFSGSFYSPSSNQSATFYIREGATTRQSMEFFLTTGGAGNTGVSAIWVGTPSAGSHTYKVSANIASGTMSLGAGATRPAFILVEAIA